MTLYCLSVHQVKTATIAQAQIGTVCEKSAGKAFPKKYKINLFIITEYHSTVKINVGSKVSGVAISTVLPSGRAEKNKYLQRPEIIEGWAKRKATSKLHPNRSITWV